MVIMLGWYWCYRMYRSLTDFHIIGILLNDRNEITISEKS